MVTRDLAAIYTQVCQETYMNHLLNIQYKFLFDQ